MKRLENKIALVLAAAQGIGKACAEEFAAEGATVYLADFNKELCDKTAENIREKYHVHTKSLFFDAYKKESYEPMINEVLADSKNTLHILVNNFGGTFVGKDNDIVHTELDAWHEVLLSNLDGVFLPTKYLLPIMVKSGGGSIINTSSLASVMSNVARIGYNTSKAAINAMTRNIALQYARMNIRCNAVLPGRILTENAEATYMTKEGAEFLKHIPMNRMGTSTDIAKAVLFLASDESSYMTGQLLEISGGLYLGTPEYSETFDTVKI